MGQREYEARYMSDGSEVVWREKIVSRGTFALLGGVALGVAGMGAAFLAASMPPLTAVIPFAAAAFLGLCSVLFSVLRTVVSRRQVHVQLGTASVKIPIERIEALEIEIYDWKRYGGWGVKRSADGVWAYSMMQAGERGLRISWRDGAGERRTIFVSSPDPERLRDAIDGARTRVAQPERVRVEVPAAGEPDEREVVAAPDRDRSREE